jgi:hypothetical protein
MSYSSWSLQKEDDNIHEHMRICHISVVTTAMYSVVSKYLCGSVPISMSEVGLIGRSLLCPFVAMGLGDITK